MLIKTQELAKKELPDNDSEITIAVNIPGQGQYVFSGVNHFQLFVEEGTAPESFELKEICCINGEFIKAVHNLVLRRLIDLVEGGMQIE